MKNPLISFWIEPSTELDNILFLRQADTVLKTHDDLRNFWRKYHHVQLERLALRSEAEALRQEGQQLRARLRYYLVSLGMTDAALTQTAAPVTVSHVTLSLSRKDDTLAKWVKPPGANGREGASVLIKLMRTIIVFLFCIYVLMGSEGIQVLWRFQSGRLFNYGYVEMFLVANYNFYNKVFYSYDMTSSCQPENKSHTSIPYVHWESQ